ncbi:MAG: porin, partial [Alphaproteobacteria bacterium]
LGTAALAAVAIATPAAAADGVKLSLGGFFTGVGGWESSDAPGHHDGGLAGNGGVSFNGGTTLDNGVEVGFTAQFVALNTCSFVGTDHANSAACVEGGVNRAYVDFATGLGRLQLGQNRGVSSQLGLTTPSVIQGISSDYAVVDPLAISTVSTMLDDSGRGPKIAYFTPRVFGVQAGVSYLWDPSRNGPLVTLVSDPMHPNAAGRTAFAAAVNFERDISDVVLRGALAYYSDNRIGGAPDPAGYNVGVQVGFKGFTFGGNYTRGDNIDHRTTYLDQSQTNIWSAGMTYGTGPWAFGLNYADGEDKVPGAGGDFKSLVGALSYELNSHVKLGLGYQHDDASPNTTSGASGDALFMETGLKF